MKDYIENIKGAERRFYSNLPELRAGSDKKTVEGLGIVYNSLSENFAPWMDGGLYEVIEPESARGLLDDEDIMILFNHDTNLVLARNKGTAELIDTPEGVRYRYNTPNTTVGNDLYENLTLTNVRKSSFAFLPAEKGVKMERGIEWDGKGKINLRRIVKFERLFDFSPVTYPAYNKTEALARGYQQVIEAELKTQNDRATKQRQIQHELEKMKLGIF